MVSITWLSTFRLELGANYSNIRKTSEFLHRKIHYYPARSLNKSERKKWDSNLRLELEENGTYSISNENTFLTTSKRFKSNLWVLSLATDFRFILITKNFRCLKGHDWSTCFWCEWVRFENRIFNRCKRISTTVNEYWPSKGTGKYSFP